MADDKTAPAAHLVTLRGAEGGGGVLVGHMKCDAPEVFVPNIKGLDRVRFIDAIQAVVNHKCPEGTPDDPAEWVTA